MAQIAPIATLLGAGASLYATARQAQAQSAQTRVQADTARAQNEARTQQAAVQQAAEQRARDARLAGTIASARARLAAGGVQPDEGSAAALTTGLERDAAAAQADSDALFGARLAAGRRSLLNDDGSLTPWLRAGATFGSTVRNLLD
jgi:multidrug efflux pump subunit AcrA (membrane-fusion protein)